ncbi:MAG TPA: SMP-30/gluconolactonase/LRE family protein [Polyangiaceae bacterium]
MSILTVEVAFRHPSELGEGALWDDREGLLYWVDIIDNKLHRFDPRNSSNFSFDVGESVGSVVLSADHRLLLGLRSGIAWFDPHTGRITKLLDPEPDKPHTRLNDGKCDPRGRFWVGTYCERDPLFDGGLYCFDANLRLTRKLDGIQCSNGIVWSQDQRYLFYIDSPTQEVWRFDYDADTGHIDQRRSIARIPKTLGSPDGMAIDSDDHLWIALFHGHRVLRLDPSDGRIEFEIPIPASNVTSVAFGGAALDELYVTTALVGLDNEARSQEPLGGSLFRVRVPHRGVVANRFGVDARRRPLE